MAVATLNQVLELAEELPADEKEMLVEILRHRRADAWRKDAARHARKAEKDFRRGRLRPIPAAQLTACLDLLWRKRERRPPARRAEATAVSRRAGDADIHDQTPCLQHSPKPTSTHIVHP